MTQEEERENAPTFSAFFGLLFDPHDGCAVL